MVAQTAMDCVMQDKPALFEGLWARTRRQAYRLAYRMTRNRDDAEDAMQEAYLRAYLALDQHNRTVPFESWF